MNQQLILTIDHEILAIFSWDGQQVVVRQVVDDYAAMVDRWVVGGVVDWLEDETPRITPSSSPLFLRRLVADLRVRFPLHGAILVQGQIRDGSSQLEPRKAA